MHYSNNFSGQGTIEYLVIMAVVVVIGLLVVGLMSSFFDSSAGFSSSLNKISVRSGVISISDLVVDGDGDGVIGLVNNTGEFLTVTSVIVGGLDTNYNRGMAGGVEEWFSLLDLSGYCDCVSVGVPQSCVVEIEYTSVNGVSQKLTKTVLVGCEGDVVTGGGVDPYDPTAPSVALLSPADGVQEDRTVEFVFDANDNIGLARCDLYLNGVYDQNITNFSSYSFSKTFTEDRLYDWDVYCADTSGNGSWSDSAHSLDIDENQYQITVCSELEEVANDLAGNYILMNDINCYGTNTWDGGAGFNPIGGNYVGVFDGNGKIISGLYINRPVTTNIGLFETSDNSLIKNFGMVDANIRGNSPVGGILGLAYSGANIANVFFDGKVNGNTSVGGIVGDIVTGSLSEPKIVNAYNMGDINGRSSVGGIVGEVSDSLVLKVYNTGVVSATQNYAGGIVGYSYNSTINNAYNVGVVDEIAVSDGGGLVGFLDGTVANSYWDLILTNQTHCYYESGGDSNVGCTPTNDEESVYYGASGLPFEVILDFDGNWVAVEGAHPKLAWED